MEANKHPNKFHNALRVWTKEPDNGKAAVFLVLCVLLAVRLTAFGTIPGGLNQDGAMAAVDAKALGEYGTDRFGTFMPAHLRAWGYGQMSALLSYLMVPFVKIFGLNRTAVRLPKCHCIVSNIHKQKQNLQIRPHPQDRRPTVFPLLQILFPFETEQAPESSESDPT